MASFNTGCNSNLMGTTAMNGAVEMPCDCGRTVEFDWSEEMVACDCGATFAVTITTLKRSPEADAN